MGLPELPDNWTYKPSWLPPYVIPDGFPFPYFTKKDILSPPRKPYFFFDTPDHEDCFKKVYNITNYGVRAAAFAATLDLLGHKQLSYSKAFGRVAFHFGRIGGSAVLYGAVTCAVANLRGNKDDELNHIIGGASVGLIWGYKYHSTAIGAMVALAVGFCGFLAKRSFIQDWVVNFPENATYIREENGVLGGQNFGDLRIGWKLKDPGRKSLE